VVKAKRIPPPTRIGDDDSAGLPAPTINSAESSAKPCARPAPYAAPSPIRTWSYALNSRPSRSLALSIAASVAERVLRFRR